MQTHGLYRTATIPAKTETGELSISEVELYFKTEETDAIAPLQQEISAWVKRNYPTAVLSFSPPETVFEKLFVTGEADIVAEFYARNKEQAPDAPTLQKN